MHAKSTTANGIRTNERTLGTLRRDERLLVADMIGPQRPLGSLSERRTKRHLRTAAGTYGMTNAIRYTSYSGGVAGSMGGGLGIDRPLTFLFSLSLEKLSCSP